MMNAVDSVNGENGVDNSSPRRSQWYTLAYNIPVIRHCCAAKVHADLHGSRLGECNSIWISVALG